MKTTEFESYSLFLQKFIDNEYSFVTFDKFIHGADRQIILRHDVDFDIELAFMMAEEEKLLNTKSTFFFMLRNPFYNPFEAFNYDIIFEIAYKLGHGISLHFDFSKRYEDYLSEFIFEFALFRMSFLKKPNVISIHRPPEKPISHFLEDANHVYKAKWFKDIKYISDSKGYFREGNPFESDWFKQGLSCQVSIHPIWWMQEGVDAVDKLRNWTEAKNRQLDIDIAENSEPYKKYMEGL